MRVFLSAGEPSGDLHGSNFAHALRRVVPSAQVDGFGGPLLAAAGQEQLYPLAEYAVMGLWRVVAALPQFRRFFKMATRQLDEHRPDAVVLVDYPGFHWHLAKAAHRRGIPVFWFVPPQIWAWATHRVKRMRKWVDHVFCNLPFETDWYRQRHVACSFIGHPYFDALAHQVVDDAFIADKRRGPGRVVALLPGSRTHEVHDNVPMMLRAARHVHERVPDARFLVAAFKPKQAEWIERQIASFPDLPAEVHVKRTPEILQLGAVCLAVSGSVSLELLHATLPTVTLYKVGPLLHPIVMYFKHTPHISLINLLADCVLSPEFLTKKDESLPMAEHLVHWLSNESARQEVVTAMRSVRDRVGQPGACDRAVSHMLEHLGQMTSARAA
jgi:lipid-A-disaccharide synthase